MIDIKNTNVVLIFMKHNIKLHSDEKGSIWSVSTTSDIFHKTVFCYCRVGSFFFFLTFDQKMHLALHGSAVRCVISQHTFLFFLSCSPHLGLMFQKKHEAVPHNSAGNICCEMCPSGYKPRDDWTPSQGASQSSYASKRVCKFTDMHYSLLWCI